MKGLLFILRRQRGVFAGVLALSLIVNMGMALITPLFLKQLFDRCITAKDMRLFLVLLGLFMILATAWRLLNLIQVLKIQRLKNGLCRDLVAELMSKYYRLPYTAVLRSAPGYFASRIFDEPLSATAAAVDLALAAAASSVSLLSAAVLLAFISLQATALVAACVPPLFWLASRYGAAVKRQAAAEKEAEGDLRGFIAKAVQAYRTVRLFALGGAVSAGLDLRASSFMGRAVERLKASSMHNSIGGILMSYAETVVIVVCGWEMMHGRMTFGGFMAFMSAFWTAVNSLRNLVQQVPELSRNEAVVERLREFLAQPEARERPAGERIRLQAAELGYGGKPVLSGVELEVGPSEALLLSGRNGSGKSTVIGALAGFLTPLRGAAGGPGVSRVSAALNPHHFIPGTVADNLGWDRLTAAQRAYLETLLEEFAVADALDKDPESLSSGQRKKIEVITALLKDADLYLFDEPLANVDAGSKAAVIDRIFERTRGKALVVVMHGDETLKARFDRAVELEPLALA